MIKYVLKDTITGKYFNGYSVFWCLTGVYGFTDDLEQARFFSSERTAKGMVTKFNKAMKNEIDGRKEDNTQRVYFTLANRDLKIVQVDIQYNDLG